MDSFDADFRASLDGPTSDAEFGAWSVAALLDEAPRPEPVPFAPDEYPALAQQLVPSSEWPYSAVVLVVSTFPNGITTAGSGVMVGRNDVLTAGHVVYQSAWGGLPSLVTVVPAHAPERGLYGNPYGASYATVTAADTGFDPDGDGSMVVGDRGPGLAGSERDVGFLTLQWPLGDRTGWMNVDPTFTSGYANLSGYPFLFNNRLTNDVAYASLDPVDSFIDIRAFEARPGNSGGPLWHFGADGQPAVVGIASTGRDGRGGAAFDVSTSYESILGWIASNDHLIG